VRHPGAVAIVPLLPDGRVVLVRQYRYAAQMNLLEIPAGTLEPNEKVEDCVRRELREETGFVAGEIQMLLNCFMAPGYSNEVIHFYIARDLNKVGRTPEHDERIDVEFFDLQKIRRFIAENVIVDAKTIIGIMSLDERYD
jgi:ADP-ribose pyrophosphatase